MKKRYSCDEIAEMYGVKKLTVWSWIRSGRLRAIRPGKSYFITPEDLRTSSRRRPRTPRRACCGRTKTQR
jgi:excisionase family DNA binding protein